MPTAPPIAMPIESLRQRLAQPAGSGHGVVEAAWAGGSDRESAGPAMEFGAVHEWFAEPGCVPPIGLLGWWAERSLAARPGRVLWIGRWCWPHPRWARETLLERSIFVDPVSDGERLWAIDQSLRCGGVSCVIADGRGISMPASRRLQLAAEQGGAMGLLARPPDERGVLSAARTRWWVRPAANAGEVFCPEPHWLVELLRCKGLVRASEARRWVVRCAHETGDVVVVPEAADRGMAAPASRQRA